MNICELETGSHLYAEAVALRYDQFFREHNLVKDILYDEKEKISKHIAIIDNDSLIACGRITDLGEGVYQFSQIVVKPHLQGKGYGTQLLKELIKISVHDGCKKIILNARATAVKFYEEQGFKSHGDMFLSKTTGVPHFQMLYSKH